MEFSVSSELKHPATRVWAVLEDFGEMGWNAPVSSRVEAEGEGVGMLRRIYMPHLIEPLIERLESIDAAAMTMTYSIVSGVPAPVSDYLVRVIVTPVAEQRCRLDLIISLTPGVGVDEGEFRHLLEVSFGLAIERLQRHLNKRQ